VEFKAILFVSGLGCDEGSILKSKVVERLLTFGKQLFVGAANSFIDFRCEGMKEDS
jgi:hypothetical protein